MVSAPPSPPSPASRTPADFPLYAPGHPYWGPTRGLIRDPIGYHLKAYRTLGPIYRTTYHGKESLVLGGLEANDFIWRNSALWDYNVTRASFREQFGTTYLTGLNGDEHKRKRRRLNPAFRPEFLASASPGMIRTARQHFAAKAGKTFDLRYFCHELLLMMTAEALLGLTVPPALRRAIIRVERDLLLGGGQGPGRTAWFQRPGYLRDKQKVVDFLASLVDRWSADPASAPDMYRAVIRPPEEGEQPISRTELIGDVYLLLTGGLNSTANLVLWSCLYLYHRPDWLAQLREEIAGAPPEQFTGMRQWPRIKATVQEIERLRPPTPVNTLLAAADFEFQGIAVPKGTALTHFMALTHFLPEIYPEPEAFRPERFLDEQAYPSKAHAAFGGGAHMCIGMPLARLEVPLILATLLPAFDLAFARRPSFRGRHSAALTPEDRRIPVTLQPRPAP